jgi:hypothetical protein
VTLLWMMAAFFVQASPSSTAGDNIVRSEVPRYVVKFPASFKLVEARERSRRFVHSCGRADWELVTATLVPASTPLTQNPSGTVTLEEMLPFVSLPPDSKTLFYTMKWNNLDVGVIEYQAVEKNLPLIGLSVVLPLQGHALTLTVSAPTPLEKEARADFQEILSRISETRVGWYTAEERGTMKTLDLVGKAGLAVLLIYPVAWALFFRGDLMRGHWVRVAWFALAAILLFAPITSPGPTTILNNLVVNALVPLLLVTLVVHRVKLGIDED